MEYLVTMPTGVADGTPDDAIDDIPATRRHVRVSRPQRTICSASDNGSCELANA
jgi:hypothetical protein